MTEKVIKPHPMSRTGAALREAGFMPLPRWWVRKDHLDIVARMAEDCSEQVSQIRREVYDEQGRNSKPKYVSVNKKLEAELAEVQSTLKKVKGHQSAIDRMWHVMNDKMLTDQDKMDIIYGELHKVKS